MSSFYINRTPSGWRALEESYKNGIRRQVTVPKLAYAALGLRPEMKMGLAKLRIKEVNSEKKLNRLSNIRWQGKCNQMT